MTKLTRMSLAVCAFLIAFIIAITLPFSGLIKAAGVPVVGQYLKTGEILVGVTGAAPVANKLTGTANQITVTTAAQGGNLTLSFPASVTVENINVTGTASWLSTGTYTAQDLVATYGVAAATGVYSSTLEASTLNTGQGDNELYGMDQDVLTTSTPAFSGATMTGALTLYSRTKAQILTIDPAAAGELYFCSDCTTTAVCVSTGTDVADMAAIENPTAICD